MQLQYLFSVTSVFLSKTYNDLKKKPLTTPSQQPLHLGKDLFVKSAISPEKKLNLFLNAPVPQ